MNRRPTEIIDKRRAPGYVDGLYGELRMLADYIVQLEKQGATPDVIPDASARCPLCGREGPHQHTPLEQIIYRNGVKAGRSSENGSEATKVTK